MAHVMLSFVPSKKQDTSTNRNLPSGNLQIADNTDELVGGSLNLQIVQRYGHTDLVDQGLESKQDGGMVGQTHETGGEQLVDLGDGRLSAIGYVGAYRAQSFEGESFLDLVHGFGFGLVCCLYSWRVVAGDWL